MVNGVRVRLQIWDIAGQRRYRSMAAIYCRDSEAVVVVYSVCERDTFSNVTEWAKLIKKVSLVPDVRMVLVGHKYCEEGEYSEEKRSISREEGEAMALSIEAAGFFEICAETGENLSAPFLFVANQKAICSPKWLSSHIVELEQQWSTTLSCKNELKKKIAAERARAKTCTRTESGLAKKSKRLKRQIQDDYERVQSAIEEAANARYRAHSAEQRQAEARRHMVDLELMVRGIKGRVTRLEQQLRNRGRQGGNMTQNSKQQFWAIGRKEIVLTDEELGRGSWAMVCIARFRGLSVAAKCLLGKNNKSDLFSREMSIIAKLRHPNLVQFIGATVEGEPIILTELMAGSVRSMLEREPLSPDQITSVSLDAARALLYLHQAQPEPIIHRDVSSANVLLNPGPANSWLAKLADFGSANYLRRVSTRDPGNPSYAAPEAAVPEQHTTKMDVYSYGVLLLEMWSWKIPEKSERQALVQGLEQREVRESIQHCLEPSPSQRPAMSDIILVLQ